MNERREEFKPRILHLLSKIRDWGLIVHDGNFFCPETGMQLAGGLLQCMLKDEYANFCGEAGIEYRNSEKDWCIRECIYTVYKKIDREFTKWEMQGRPDHPAISPYKPSDEPPRIFSGGYLE